MKRITLWFLSTLSVVVLLFGYDGSKSVTTSAALPPAVISSSASNSASSSGSGATTTTPSKAAKAPAKKATAKTSSTKTVTGSVASTQWGPVQVSLRISGNKITKVSVLQYPSGNSRDAEINSYALPILTRETRSSQSASIDMVSGATVTSTGYLQSLQSAIDQASL